MKRYGLWITIGIIAGLLLVVGFTLTRPYRYNGSLIDPPMPAPDFTLRQAGDTTFHLGGQSGKAVLVFFGYTSCPDVCPMTLADMRQVRSLLKDKQDKVDFVFITVDPARDTPERMQQYVTGFDPTFIGLSGSDAELEPVYKSYGVYREIPPGQDANNYTVDHSARIYLIDPAGQLRLTYPYDAPVEEIAQDVRQVLRKAS